jgi:hypothetical protein
VLETDVRSPPAAASASTTATTATAAPAEASATAATTTAAAATASGAYSAAATATEACPPARRFATGYATRTNISKRAIALWSAPAGRSRASTGPVTSGPRIGAGAASAAARAIAGARTGRTIAATDIAAANISTANIATTATGPEHLLAAAAPEVHPVAGTRTKIIVAELLPHVGIAVSHALAMLRPVLPVVATARPVARIVDIDVVIVPIDRAIPGVAAGHPAPHRVAGAERQSGGD